MPLSNKMPGQHTPGPWGFYADPNDGSNPNIYIDAPNYGDVCVMGGGLLDDRMANARLIAAAPEMLTALIIAMQYQEECHFGRGINNKMYHLLSDGTLGASVEECWRCRVRAVIEKAKGGAK